MAPDAQPAVPTNMLAAPAGAETINKLTCWPLLLRLLAAAPRPSPASVFVRRYPLIVAVGSVVGIPVNLAVDALLRGAAFGGAQVGGTLLVMGAFFLMVLPDDMANAVTPACCKPAHVERAAGAAGGGGGRAYAAVRNGAGRLQSAKAVLSAAAEGGGAADGVRHALPVP